MSDEVDFKLIKEVYPEVDKKFIDNDYNINEFNKSKYKDFFNNDNGANNNYISLNNSEKLKDININKVNNNNEFNLGEIAYEEKDNSIINKEDSNLLEKINEDINLDELNLDNLNLMRILVIIKKFKYLLLKVYNINKKNK